MKQALLETIEEFFLDKFTNTILIILLVVLIIWGDWTKSTTFTIAVIILLLIIDFIYRYSRKLKSYRIEIAEKL